MTSDGAIVVGSGPNGLAAAVTLARHGVPVTVLEAADRIGGGTRSGELTVPGLLHDHCSAAHPFGVASPFFRSLGLDRYGLRWRWPEIDFAHPLDHDPSGSDRSASGRLNQDRPNRGRPDRNRSGRGRPGGDRPARHPSHSDRPGSDRPRSGEPGSGESATDPLGSDRSSDPSGSDRSDQAAVLVRSIDETAAGLGADGPTWQRLFGPLAAAFDDLAEDILRPPLHLPRHPLRLARFGTRALLPASVVIRSLRTERARALFAGAAAHAFQPPHRPATGAMGMALIAAGHRYGWPVAEGGSQAITDALAALLTELGGTIETGVTVRSLTELPPTATVLLDVAPAAAIDIIGDRLPAPVRHAYQRFRYGPGAFKVDLAVEGGVPWLAEPCRRAGTVHVGGSPAEIAHAEREIVAGRLPERPFVLVGQQYLADPGRSSGDVHPVWAYAHVPNGFPGDATELILDQIERFAPGLRDRIVGRFVRSTRDFTRYNPNYVGGDIGTGANTMLQILARPRLAIDPYRTGVPNVFLCSAATPPGGGVHGMCGHLAACSALRSLVSRNGVRSRWPK